MKTNLVRDGIYEIPLAARLTQIPESRVRAWTTGYGKKRKGPLIDSQYEKLGGRYAMGFLDLIEVRFVDKFIEQGVKPQTMRLVIENAKKELGVSHPFSVSSQKFKMDKHGKKVFLEMIEQQDRRLLDLTNNHFAMVEIIQQTLLDGVEFDAEGLARRWYPERAKYSDILLDPRIAFGKPIIHGHNITTYAVMDAFKAEGNIDAVADWFDIKPALIKQAVEFHIDRALK